jgi:hypothetical protein
MRIGPYQLSSNLFLSPLAGYTNLPMRLTVRELGGLGWATTDLVNARSLIERNRVALQLVASSPEDRPLAIQLFGSVPEEMRDAAVICQELGADAVDINMGCPVKKVVKIAGHGLPAPLDQPLEGIAVLAENTWAAIKGSEALEIEWDLGPNQTYNSSAQLQEMLKSTASTGTVKRERGNFNQAKSSSGKILENTYLAPFYAHSTIEPPAAIADVKADGSVEIWSPSQHPQWAKGAVATALGIEPANVKINVTLLGGGFGRKSKPDFVVEAALLSKAADAHSLVALNSIRRIGHHCVHLWEKREDFAAVSKVQITVANRFLSE